MKEENQSTLKRVAELSNFDVLNQLSYREKSLSSRLTDDNFTKATPSYMDQIADRVV
jgi:hypothetical protein